MQDKLDKLLKINRIQQLKLIIKNWKK